MTATPHDDRAPSLADFLLARIAEDEARTRLPEVGSPIEVMLPSITGYMLVHPARVLAECEAKRRIIRDVEGLSGQWYDEIEDKVLCALALPYADHPAYDERWKP